MTLFDARRIEEMTDGTLAEAKRLLAALPVACGQEPQIAGLHGWAFEQVVLGCLRQELEAVGLQPEFRQQVPFGGRRCARGCTRRRGRYTRVEDTIASAYL